MAMVSSYFSQVGIDIDRRSLRSAQAYFRSVERIINNFQRRITRKQTLNLAIRVDRQALQRNLQNAATRAARGIRLTFNQFDINKKSLTRSFNKAFPSNPKEQGSVRIGVRLSTSSLTHMKDQIRQALNSTVISPRINPRLTTRAIAAPRGSGGGAGGRAEGGKYLDPRNTKRQSPWHNPMMVGGGAGAFMRYGFYSLPFVGGVLGLNAANNFAMTQVAQRTSLDMVAQGSTMGKDGGHYRDYLKNLALETGKTVQNLTPLFTQFLAGSQGTGMEESAESTFGEIVKYASVMGLNDESVKLAMRGVVQMIGKQQIMAEELKNQVGEHIPTAVRLMADAVTGGDTKALFKMMEAGQLDPNVHLPMMAEKMREKSAPMMETYRDSLPYLMGISREHQDEFLRKFNTFGGEAGFTTFWRVWQQMIEESLSSAESMGRYFEKAATLFSASLLVPQELVRWTEGETDEKNIWQSIFGDFDSNEDMQSIRASLASIKKDFGELGEILGVLVPNNLTGMIRSTATELAMLGKVVEGLFNIITPIVETFVKSDRLLGSVTLATGRVLSGDFAGANAAVKEQDKYAIGWEARRMADSETDRRMEESFGPNRADWPTEIHERVKREERARFNDPRNSQGVKGVSLARARGDGFIDTMMGLIGIKKPQISDIPYYSDSATYMSPTLPEASTYPWGNGGNPLSGVGTRAGEYGIGLKPTFSLPSDRVPSNNSTQVQPQPVLQKSEVKVNVSHDLGGWIQVENISSAEAIEEGLTRSLQKVAPMMIDVPQ